MAGVLEAVYLARAPVFPAPAPVPVQVEEEQAVKSRITDAKFVLQRVWLKVQPITNFREVGSL